MSKAQHNLPASGAESAFPEPVPDHATGQVSGAEADGKAPGKFGTNNGADLGGHTLLSRPPAPQGRRSLFRR